ncbi:Delta-1-pyrroline-5-carboxylate dehydrogenase [Penicillium malachiteum]|uniref:Delta-1-pyrroline-5-carboxylate dehydrogenase n=1 Tax=Penicillium malachiteum TaxID=1324776 RepID=UPI0025499A4B|nr:Delta-1-pyrroline-5-carboxylate dehydrogenase [Penicillium malachiteum]KAJ5718836.1 Delta-1-pyrroline-5-carboxylate dehydrogenase [Penicillium malachiteum]
MTLLCVASKGLSPTRRQVSRIRTYVPSISRSLSLYQKPSFQNEPTKAYARGSPELAGITKALEDLKAKLPVQLPLQIGSENIKSPISAQINPARHSQVIAEWVPARKSDIKKAIDAALAAKPSWENLPFEDRAAVFLRAAELISGKYRYPLMAATMLNQGKNIREAEIDAAAESCDLLRFNVQCAMDMFKQQPAINSKGMWNRLEYRPLEGFVYAIAPFNFTALCATLACGPLLMGNVVILKPSLSALHSSWLFHQILLEAGLPKDVLQFVPGDAEEITNAVLESRDFAGLNFTGSTHVFRNLIAKIGIATGEGRFLSYPRIVGETGGKNFHLIHESAEIESAVNCTIRGAFEFQGQKCSAPSRLYVSESVWPDFKRSLLQKMNTIKVGSPENPENYINPIIHEQAFDRMVDLFERAKSDANLTLITGGKAEKDVGFYVYPTVYQTTDPQHEIMQTEYFGPMFSVYVFPDNEWESIPKLIDTTSSYALTGSIFAKDPSAIRFACDALKHSAGNFYVNTKSTGSVVGQQPFGGSRGSGTNDKVGSVNTLSRFVSVRTVKEEFDETTEFSYPNFQSED